MSEHFARINWARADHENYIDNQYSRGHKWSFDGGATVAASSSSHIVPLPYSIEENIDPEEAFIASLSSCHMLTFLGIAAKKRYVVDTYEDNAVGVMVKGENNKLFISKVTLRPEVIFSGNKQPNIEQLEKLHHLSHEQCFIANSVKTEVVTEIVNANEQ